MRRTRLYTDSAQPRNGSNVTKTLSLQENRIWGWDYVMSGRQQNCSTIFNCQPASKKNKAASILCKHTTLSIMSSLRLITLYQIKTNASAKIACQTEQHSIVSRTHLRKGSKVLVYQCYNVFQDMHSKTCMIKIGKSEPNSRLGCCGVIYSIHNS